MCTSYRWSILGGHRRAFDRARVARSLIGLVQTGDVITIDIPARSITLDVSDEELAKRRVAEEARGADAWTATNRDRVVSQALLAYAALTTSAARGAVRDLSQLRRD